MQPLLALFVIFAEPGFPMLGVDHLPEVPDAIVAAGVAELEQALTPGRVLVWRHGSAFPNDAWPTVRRHLERGGSLLYLGGEPFGAPIAGEPGRRIALAPSIAMRKSLRLNQCFDLDAGGAGFAPVGNWGGRLFAHTLATNARVAVLEPRFCDTKDFSSEDGSPGSRDAIVRPLAHLHRAGDDRRLPFAAAALAIDRLRGPFAGGRWVFWLISTPPSDAELTALLAEAAREPIDFRVDPTLGCFHEHERPSVILRCHRPRATQPWEATVTLTVAAPDGAATQLDPVTLRGAEHATLPVPLPAIPTPGLYRVFAESPELDEASTGFWIFDPILFAAGDDLTLDSYTLRRNGRPEPVVGTTVMSQTVHRDFLFEPNAAVWDDTFAELASLKINLVRTGVWSGFRKISLDPGVIDEAWLRALEAYYLTARKHGIPVLFTFFAFLPESFGGENPYFDPRAIEGQRAYLAAVASRFAPAKEILWDLINEPSFSSPRHLWRCRPNGDAFEQRAFLTWLEQRFSTIPEIPPSDVSTSLPWQDIVRQRWRLLPDDPITLPTESDFADATVFETAKPYRAADYLLFAQEAFTDWAFQMRSAIRSAGSTAAITVGQDEGGLTQRPSPLFHHPAVDFTSMHTWWNNDALLWDGLAAKAGNKPLLISETGVMNRELLSGQALRTPEDSAKLLSRKLGYAFASGAFGVIQWCYNVNPYMVSDNEVAIGLKRIDGSYKPEHRILRDFAAFIARNRERFESPFEPEVVVVGTADVLLSRDHGAAAVRRAVDALVEGLGISARIVPDPELARDLGKPKAIILPACSGISDQAWKALLAAVQGGAGIICTGWFECDEVGLPARRLGVGRRSLELVEPCSLISGSDPSATTLPYCEYALRFPRSTSESWYAAVGPSSLRTHATVPNRLLHHPLPLEWQEHRDVLLTFYGIVSAWGAKVASPRSSGAPPPTGVLVRRLALQDSILEICINDTSQPQRVAVTEAQRIDVPSGECRMFILNRTGETILDRSHPDQE